MTDTFSISHERGKEINVAEKWRKGVVILYE